MNAAARPRRRSRRIAAALGLAGAACLAVSSLPLLQASAAEGEPGSGFGFFNLAANAPVLQLREDYAASNCSASPAGTAACEGVLNESVSTLRTGPVGHALSSVGWPGTLGGNAGSLILVAQPGAPSQVTMLNDPVRAENFTGGKDDTVTNTTVPGAVMSATATETKVAAAASLGASQAPGLGGFGRASSSTQVLVTGASQATAEAHSSLQDLDLGVLHVGAVRSDVVASTDGRTAKAVGRTVVTGATVNGVPVTVDEHGVTAGSQNAPLPTQATAAVNQVLSQAGMTLVLSGPTVTRTAGDVDYNAGSLVLVWKQQGAGTLTFLVGGAQVALKSAPGFDVGGGGGGAGTSGTGGASFGTTGSGTAPLTPAGPPAPSLTTGTPGQPPSTRVPPPVVDAQPRAALSGLPRGLDPWFGALAGLGALLVMAGLRRLPDRVLAASAVDCPNGEPA